MSLLTHWKEWFESWAEHKVGHTISVEEMYQAFKARLIEEPVPSKAAESHATDAAPLPPASCPETPHA